MARISLGICMLLVVASSVIYEAQGTFLLKLYLKNKFPAKCSDFTPFANKGMLMLMSNLEGGCPATAEFKNFFAKFKAYMTFFETAQATSKNIDVEMKTKADGLFSAMSVLNGGQGGKSADAGSFKSTMLSMGKTLVEQKKSTKMMTFAQKKELIVAMVKWTRMLATFVKTACEKKGKSIDISSYGLDVDVNDKSIVSGTSKSSGSSSTENESSSSTEKASSSAKFESSAKKGTVAGSSENTPSKKEESTGAKTESASSDKEADVASSGKTSSKKEESSGTKTESASSDKKGAASKTKESSGKSFKDTTGGKSGSPSGSPTGSPSSS